MKWIVIKAKVQLANLGTSAGLQLSEQSHSQLQRSLAEIID